MSVSELTAANDTQTVAATLKTDLAAVDAARAAWHAHLASGSQTVAGAVATGTTATLLTNYANALNAVEKDAMLLAAVHTTSRTS